MHTSLGWYEAMVSAAFGLAALLAVGAAVDVFFFKDGPLWAALAVGAIYAVATLIFLCAMEAVWWCRARTTPKEALDDFALMGNPMREYLRSKATRRIEGAEDDSQRRIPGWQGRRPFLRYVAKDAAGTWQVECEHGQRGSACADWMEASMPDCRLCREKAERWAKRQRDRTYEPELLLWLWAKFKTIRGKIWWLLMGVVLGVVVGELKW